MIETKEQYEDMMESALKFPSFRLVHPDWVQLNETFEALREVATVAQFAKYMAASSLDRPLNDQLDKLRAALEKVPDWLVDG